MEDANDATTTTALGRRRRRGGVQDDDDDFVEGDEESDWDVDEYEWDQTNAIGRVKKKPLDDPLTEATKRRFRRRFGEETVPNERQESNVATGTTTTGTTTTLRWKRERVLEEDKASNDAAVMATTTNPLLFVGVSRGAREKEADEKRFLSEREHREEETKKDGRVGDRAKGTTKTRRGASSISRRRSSACGRRRAATDRRSSSTCSAALGGPTRNHRATPRGCAASRSRSAGSMARVPEAGPPRAGLTCLRPGLIPRDGACLGVGGVLALEARARAGAAHDGRAEFTGTAVSWGIHLFQVPFHPVWVERRLARVEVSRLPARHVGGPRVEV